MSRLALVIWLMLGTALAGSAVLVVLSVPDLSNHAMKWLPIAGLVGFIVALPLSSIVSKRIS